MKHKQAAYNSNREKTREPISEDSRRQIEKSPLSAWSQKSGNGRRRCTRRNHDASDLARDRYTCTGSRSEGKPKEDRTQNLCLTLQHDKSSENQEQARRSEKNGILPGVLKNNSNGSRPLFRHHGRQNIFQMLKENKNRLSTQKPTLNKNMLSSRGKKKEIQR